MTIKTSEFFNKLYTRNGKHAKGIIFLGTKTKDSMINKRFPVQEVGKIDAFCNQEDSINKFFTPNSFSRLDLDNLNSAEEKKAYQNKGKTADKVISLNAFFVDIDYKKQGLELDYVLDEVKKRTKFHISAIINSGNGLHVYYFIDFVYIPKRTSKTGSILRLYEKSLKGLLNSFKDLGADPNAVSISNYLRLPNTMNVKENFGVNSVEILELNDYYYTLSDIAKIYAKDYSSYLKGELQFPNSDNKKKYKKNKQTSYQQKGLSQMNIANDRVDDLIKLIDLRDGKVESRNSFIMLCIYLKSNRVFELNSHFAKPEKESNIKAILKYHKNQLVNEKELEKLNDGKKDPNRFSKMSKWKNESMIKFLKITTSEQKQLKTIISKEESRLRDRENKRIKAAPINKLKKEYKEFQKQLEIYMIKKLIKEKKTSEEIAKELKISVRKVKELRTKKVDVKFINKFKLSLQDNLNLTRRNKDKLKVNIKDMSIKEIKSLSKNVSKITKTNKTTKTTKTTKKVKEES